MDSPTDSWPLSSGVIKLTRIKRPLDALPVFSAVRCLAGIPVDFESVAVRIGTIQRPADQVVNSMHSDPLLTQPTVNAPEFLPIGDLEGNMIQADIAPPGCCGLRTDLLQGQFMMHAAGRQERKGIARLFGDLQAEMTPIEFYRSLQIPHLEMDMTQLHDGTLSGQVSFPVRLRFDGHSLDLQVDGHFVTDHYATGFERLVPAQAVVMTIDHGAGGKASPLITPGVGIGAAETAFEGHFAGGAANGEVTVNRDVIS